MTSTARTVGLFVAVALGCAAPACHRDAPEVVIAASETFAELRAIKGDVAVLEPGEASRGPYPRERLTEGTTVTLANGALVWIRRDSGAVLLVSGPARLALHQAALDLTEGRAFVDTNGGPPQRIDTARGPVELADARASVEVPAGADVSAYVLRGSARSGASGRAGAGETLTLSAKEARTAPAVVWNDWTGGLATTDAQAEPAPFGIGTVGARAPGDKGKPRFSLVVQRLDVRVTVDHELAVTEVDETFVNPSSSTVEGLFSFRTPPGAVLQRFGVDRDGDIVWGRVKESAAAVAQYESNVYAGSAENPALLTWTGPGIYSARLYPIAPGAQRRVVTRYTEWLAREGPRGDRRLYVYPMAAEGAPASLPRIEELTVTIDLARAGALKVRSGMGGHRDGQRLVINAFDLVPLADLAVELFDDGETTPVAYRAPHALAESEAPAQAGATFASKVSSEEADYLLVPLRSTTASDMPAGIDLAVVVDTSAATEPGALAVARSLASALLAHLGPADRAALWAGDATLHPVAEGSDSLTTLDDPKRRAWLDGLSATDRGGATDIGALLTAAASKLDPNRRGAVVYVGDGQPSVGEIAPKALGERLRRLPASTRIFACALGSNANTAVLQSLARGAPLETVSDAYGAARTALRLLAAAFRPAWVGASVDLGPGVERILPTELPAVGADESVLVVGRITGKVPTEITLRGNGQTLTKQLHIGAIDDVGDLRRRWGEQRVASLVAEGAGRASVVDVGVRYGLVSPFTALYVPTTREATTEQGVDPSVVAEREDRLGRWKPWTGSRGAAVLGFKSEAPPPPEALATGTFAARAKGEEGAMGNPKPTMPSPIAQAAPAASAAAANAPGGLDQSAQFGIGGLQDESDKKVAEPAVPSDIARAKTANATEIRSSTPWAAQRSLSGAGVGGGGRGEGIDLSRHASGPTSFIPLHPDTTLAAPTVEGRLARDVIERIVRQNIGRFKLCFENGQRDNPALAGRVVVKFVIGHDGAVTLTTDAGSDLPNHDVVQCVVRGFGNLSFPTPEAGNVTVRYPVVFRGGDVKPAEVSVEIATVGHAPKPCSPAADLPLSERRVLWGERLSAATQATAALAVYRGALEGCEAPTWRERNALLLAAVGHLPTIGERVALWRELLEDAAEADVVYRATLVRVQTAAELKELHDALGLRSIDPDLLARILAGAKTPAARLAMLRDTAVKWPDDLELALRVLDGFDDLGDDGAGRAWARRLRHRPDATAHVFTRVGEYYLRLARRETGAAAQHDTDEARRTFGEIVEFAPEDPVARRRLGDLLRAHGWYEEAFRQYETLAQLTPDDASVPLLMALAAQGMGRVEEAVSRAEKAAAAGAPDGTSGLSKAARATASAFLAWAEADASRAGRKEDVEKLRARAKRVSAADAPSGGSVRFIVTWSHPELHPVLWTWALGAPMPAEDNLPLYGVAQAVLPPATPRIELRLDSEDAARAARLGAKAVVTALVDPGTATERLAHVDVTFGDPSRPLTAVTVRLADDGLHVEGP